jgi:hypothetical protein
MGSVGLPRCRPWYLRFFNNPQTVRPIAGADEVAANGDETISIKIDPFTMKDALRPLQAGAGASSWLIPELAGAE